MSEMTDPTETLAEPYVCPAVLMIAGKHFPCDWMDQMAPGSQGHDGWAHANRAAEAIWSDSPPAATKPDGLRAAVEALAADLDDVALNRRQINDQDPGALFLATCTKALRALLAATPAQPEPAAGRVTEYGVEITHWAVRRPNGEIVPQPNRACCEAVLRHFEAGTEIVTQVIKPWKPIDTEGDQ